MARTALFSLVLGALTLAGPLAARSPDDMVRISVLPGWRDADGTHMAALRFEMAEGWKTYWRAPGEAGIPPRFDWRGSRNLGAVEILWPTPQQTTTNGMRTIGYEHDLILPVRLTPARAGEPICRPMRARAIRASPPPSPRVPTPPPRPESAASPAPSPPSRAACASWPKSTWNGWARRRRS
jgi:DsbC/DsbD-like thiol-disulfide interchange protein